MKTYCLYHKDCWDGFAAAWVVHKNIPDTIFIPVQYQEPLPSVDDNSVIYIVDFSYSESILRDLIARSNKVIVIDHHKTALNNLSFILTNSRTYTDDRIAVLNSNKINVLFDLKQSGCTLTWNYFNRDELPPELLCYIEDRDLWNWKLPYSEQINLRLGTYDKDFIIIDNLINNWAMQKEYLIDDGCILQQQQNNIIRNLIAKAEITDFRGYNEIPLLNSCIFQSELGNRLLEVYGAPFVVIYFHPTFNEIVYSLRSRKGEFDVSELARKYGGGGHQSAAGFKE